MTTDRQYALLGQIIDEYVASAKPVSSGQLVKEEKLELSPATIRNDMAALTDTGFLLQPHTSAGRIPTEKAWRWYIEQEAKAAPLTKREQAILRSVVSAYRADGQELMKRLARAMAEVTDESALVAWSKHDTYYTGLSNLFQQPEFEHVDLMQSMSRVVDHLDEVVSQMFDRVGAEPQILVGKDNPFSQACGSILVKYCLDGQPGLFGIIGPLRQDYPSHVALLKFTNSLLHAA